MEIITTRIFSFVHVYSKLNDMMTLSRVTPITPTCEFRQITYTNQSAVNLRMTMINVLIRTFHF